MTQILLLSFTTVVEKHIIHCKLRLGLSDLNYDLLNKHLTTNNSCDCGERKETSQHYILHCPPFTHVRHKTIFKLPANALNISTLLQGEPNMSNNMNSLIFKAVLDFLDVWLFQPSRSFTLLFVCFTANHCDPSFTSPVKPKYGRDPGGSWACLRPVSDYGSD